MDPKLAEKALARIQKRRAKARRAWEYFERKRREEAEEASEAKNSETKLGGLFENEKN